MKQFLFPVFSLFLFLFSACSDGLPDPLPFTVTGTVSSDRAGQVEGVLVNSVVDTVLTDAEGRYEIQAHPRGGIEYSKNGFQKWVETVGGRHQIDVSLLEIPAGNETRFDVVFGKSQCANGDSLDVVTVEVKDFGQGTGDMTWTRDKIWVLKNRVFVNEGQVLSIQPGTIVKAAGGQGESAAALIVARGGQIFAEGTAELPIIFTSIDDPILRMPDGSICQNTDLTETDRGHWGGLVVLGRASLNSAAGEAHAEGVPTSEPRAIYGGPDDMDNSGILRYVSIRHAGTFLGLGNEINALTLAGVGRGTTVDFVEAFACADDGFEFFGGTVDTRHLVSAYSADDAFDYDEGWRGRNQFWFSIQSGDSDRGGEHDGGTDPKDGQPFATPLIFNATFRGPGMATGKRAVSFADNAGGGYHNSIFMDFAFGADVEYLGPGEQDAFHMFEEGYLVFQNNLLFDIGNQPVFALRNVSPQSDSEPGVAAARLAMESYFADPANGNSLTDPDLDILYVPRPNGPAATGPASEPTDSFFENTGFRGCFAPGETRWMDGWTRLDGQ